MNPDTTREQQIASEYEDTLGRSTEHLNTACRAAAPADPAVMAILARWRNGSSELPWSDATPETGRTSSEEKER